MVMLAHGAFQRRFQSRFHAAPFPATRNQPGQALPLRRRSEGARRNRGDHDWSPVDKVRRSGAYSIRAWGRGNASTHASTFLITGKSPARPHPNLYGRSEQRFPSHTSAWLAMPMIAWRALPSRLTVVVRCIPTRDHICESARTLSRASDSGPVIAVASRAL